MSAEWVLKRGSTGARVEALQRALGVPADGVFGARTEAAVIAFQQARGLVADGVAGPKTRAALVGVQADLRRLSTADIKCAADDLGVDVAAVHAVVDVESRGEGFLPDGRPAILFERHIMRRQLAAAGRDADLLARYLPDVINAQSGGYRGGAAEHDRLHLARQIEPTCAVESASWGLFQIMGFHWRRLGYGSAAEFEAQMRRSEADHLNAFVRFVRADPALHLAIQRRDWPTVAERYNGPAYRANLYDTKLAAAYSRHSTTRG